MHGASILRSAHPPLSIHPLYLHHPAPNPIKSYSSTTAPSPLPMEPWICKAVDPPAVFSGSVRIHNMCLMGGRGMSLGGGRVVQQRRKSPSLEPSAQGPAEAPLNRRHHPNFPLSVQHPLPGPAAGDHDMDFGCSWAPLTKRGVAAHHWGEVALGNGRPIKKTSKQETKKEYRNKIKI